MPARSIDQRDAVRQYLAGFELRNCFGVSLTLKQIDDGVQLDEIRASKNLLHFLNRLNTEIYGKRFRRFGKKLKVFPSLERSSSNRLHYHLVLENPYPSNPDTFIRLIEVCWSQTKFGYQQVHVHQQIDHGWSDYITKSQSASDGVDWLNVHSN